MRIMVGAASTSAASQVTTTAVTASALRDGSSNRPNRHTAQYRVTNTTSAGASNRYAAPSARSPHFRIAGPILLRLQSPFLANFPLTDHPTGMSKLVPRLFRDR